MTNATLTRMYDELLPSAKAKDRMLQNILVACEEASIPYENAPQQMMPFRKYLALPAAAACLTLFTCTAYGENWLHLKELLLGHSHVIESIASTDPHGSEILETTERDVELISLSGAVSSPEYQACKEYLDFVENYDPDGKLLAKADEEGFSLPDRYAPYPCYTQEMADKLDDICSYYHLKLLGRQLPYQEEQDFFAAAGIGHFPLAFDEKGNNMVYPQYVYEDGSFKFEGEITLYDYPVLIGYESLHLTKGSMSTIVLNIEDIDDYQTWIYTTTRGQSLLLCLSNYKALIFFETEDTYTTINITDGLTWEKADGSIDQMDQSSLEDIAELFDFSSFQK